MSKPLGIKSATKEHRQKKNPQSAEAFAEKRHAKNAERPKQVWVPSEVFIPELDRAAGGCDEHRPSHHLNRGRGRPDVATAGRQTVMLGAWIIFGLWVLLVVLIDRFLRRAL